MLAFRIASDFVTALTSNQIKEEASISLAVQNGNHGFFWIR